MYLLSKAFTNGGLIPQCHTCEGDNTAPPLEIRDVPKGAKSLVLLVDDPDVPLSIREEGIYDHWVLFNIPPETRGIYPGTSLPGILGRTTGGVLGYEGPCPPWGKHRYFFKLYALDSLLELAEGATKGAVEKAMRGHILVEASLMGHYQKREAAANE